MYEDESGVTQREELTGQLRWGRLVRPPGTAVAQVSDVALSVRVPEEPPAGVVVAFHACDEGWAAGLARLGVQAEGGAEGDAAGAEAPAA